MKVRGFQVAPAELEGHLLTHWAVADVCVVGVPDTYNGETPRAFVVLCEAAVKRVAIDIRTSIIEVGIVASPIFFFAKWVLLEARC
jgi:acyl-coenzyme A synthetase/AMP-(fatty) acid ligase